MVPFQSGATIGGRNLAVIAGPCSIESREQAFAIAEQVAAAGAQFFRGGAYKPRTSPYAFQGLGLEALKIMAEVREKFGLRIVTEALDSESLDLVAEWADVIQIGARNMQNFSLLKKAGRTRKPVLLKRRSSVSVLPDTVRPVMAWMPGPVRPCPAGSAACHADPFGDVHTTTF